MAKRDREGLFDPKHYWARRVKKKHRYPRGGSGQYPATVGAWELDKTWYDADAHGNRVYETEDAHFEHPSGGAAAIYHHSGPEGETWEVAAIPGRGYGDVAHDSLKDALAALKLTGGRKRKAAPKKPARGVITRVRGMTAKELCAIGDRACEAELLRRGRHPKTGKKRR